MTNKVVKMTRIQVKTERRKEKGEADMPLENRLKEHRARLGINQADMGKRAGV